MRTLSSPLQSSFHITIFSPSSGRQGFQTFVRLTTQASTMSTQQSNGKLFWDDPRFSVLYKQAEKFTGTFAKLMLAQADFQKDAKTFDRLTVLDDACGTGVVSGHIVKTFAQDAKSKLDLTCADFADSMVDFTQKRIEAEGWPAKAIKADAQDTKLPSNNFTHVFFNFGPFLLPNPSAGMQECLRMLKPGGLMGATSWQHVAWTQDIREAFALHPELPPFPSDEVFYQTFSKDAINWTHPDRVKAEFEKHRFVDVKVEAYTRTIELDSYHDFVAMLPGSLGMIMSKHWTEEQRTEYKEKAEKWCEEYLKEKYEEEAIVWTWTAIVGTGKKPA